MDDYRTRVEMALKRRDGTTILNGSADHASIIVEAMFRNSKESIHILSSELNARIFGRREVVDEVNLFLADPKHTLQVVVEDPSRLSSVHPFVKELSGRNNAEIRVADSFIKENFKSHFIVMDGDSYRFEKDKREPIAIAAFGDREGAKNLDEVFAQVWTTSAQLELADA